MRTISKKYTPVKDNSVCNNIKTHLYYDKGGMNYFTGKVEKRGIYLSITPVKRSEFNGGVSEVTTAFTGTKVLLEEKSRFSQKLYDFEPSTEQENALLDHVLNQNGISKELLTK